MLPPPGYRIFPGETIAVVVVSSVAATMNGVFRVEYDDGTLDFFNIQAQTLGTSRAYEFLATNHSAKQRGTIVSGVLRSPTNVLRGQLGYQMNVGRKVDEPDSIPRQVIGHGYYYNMSSPTLGYFSELGPGGGEGNKTPITLASDVAGDTDTSAALALADTLRRIDGFILYYHASSDVDNRTMTVRVRSPGLAVPTGFDAGNDQQVMAFAGPTLSADQDGIVFMRPGIYTVVVDNNTITTSDNTTAPNPFPFWVTEGDNIEIVLDITTGHANDRYSAYAFGEEWIRKT